MIDVDEARALTEESSQNEQMEEARVRREREDAIRSEAFEALPETLEVLDERIREAAARGETEITETSDEELVQAALYHLVDAHYRDRRFSSNVMPTTADMGDSAAPAIVRQLTLTISWRVG